MCNLNVALRLRNYFKKFLQGSLLLKRVLKSWCPLNGGENDRRTLIGTAKRWLRALNRGDCLIEVRFTIYSTIISGR